MANVAVSSRDCSRESIIRQKIQTFLHRELITKYRNHQQNRSLKTNISELFHLPFLVLSVSGVISLFLFAVPVFAAEQCKDLSYNKFLMERHCITAAQSRGIFRDSYREYERKAKIASKLLKNNQFKWGIQEDGNNCNLTIYTQGVLDGNSYLIEVQCQISNAYRRCVNNWFNDDKADHMVCARIMFKDAGDSRKTVNRSFFIR